MINSYCFKPEPIFFTTNDEKNSGNDVKEFYGIELEIIGEDRYQCSKLLEEDEFFYCKYDCSIGNRGIEIVSHPASFNFHINSKKWVKLYDVLYQTKMYDNIGCGLHVHVNKNGFDQESLSVLDFFVNKNKKLMEDFGGREFGHFCKNKNKSISDWGIDKFSEHCDSVNFSNRNTVEIRFFESPIQINDFFKSLFIIKNIILFSKDTKFQDIRFKNNIQLFYNFLSKNETIDSKYIKQFLIKRRYI